MHFTRITSLLPRQMAFVTSETKIEYLQNKELETGNIFLLSLMCEIVSSKTRKLEYLDTFYNCALKKMFLLILAVNVLFSRIACL